MWCMLFLCFLFQFNFRFVLVCIVVAQTEGTNAVESQTVEEPAQASRFTWTLENFSRMNVKKQYSETFVVGSYKWYLIGLCFFKLYVHYSVYYCYLKCGRGFYCFIYFLRCRRVLIFPKGNNVDHLSMYLDVADSGSLPYGWSRYAQFSLAVINQIQPKFTVKKGNIYTNHTVLHIWFFIIPCSV